jgi:hypothetical protein
MRSLGTKAREERDPAIPQRPWQSGPCPSPTVSRMYQRPITAERSSGSVGQYVGAAVLLAAVRVLLARVRQKLRVKRPRRCGCPEWPGRKACFFGGCHSRST